VALGLAFEGCAGRAAFHAGVVDGLHRAGVAPACVAGASSGSIVAALVAAGLPDRLVDIWRSASDQAVFRPRRILRGRWPFAMSQIVGDALESVFQERRLESLALPIAIPVTLVGVRGRRRRILTREDDISVVEAVLASCFIPGPYSRVVAIDRCLAVDGAWDVRTPMEAVLQLGASRVIAVVANPERELQLGFPTSDRLRPPEDCIVVGPEEPLPVGAWDTDAGRVDRAIEAGRRAAARLVSEGGAAPFGASQSP
jgi:predicted acylesterase/phospholipase RssA